MGIGTNLLKQKMSDGKAVSKAHPVVDVYVETKASYDELMEQALAVKAEADEMAGLLRADADAMYRPDEKAPISGETHKVELSVRPEAVQEVDQEKVLEIMGADLYIKLAKVSIGDLRQYLSPEEFAKVASVERTGTRRIKVVK